MARPNPCYIRRPDVRHAGYVFLALTNNPLGKWARISLANNVWVATALNDNRGQKALPIGSVVIGQPRDGGIYTLHNGRLVESPVGVFGSYGEVTDTYPGAVGFNLNTLGESSGHHIRYTASASARTLTCTIPAGHDYIAVRYMPSAENSGKTITMTIGGQALPSWNASGGGSTRHRMVDKIIPITPSGDNRAFVLTTEANNQKSFFYNHVRSWCSTLAADPRGAVGGLWRGCNFVEEMNNPWQTGTLSLRVGDGEGTVTLGTDHGILQGHGIEIQWDGGRRYALGTGVIDGANIPFGASASLRGFGDALPIEGTDVQCRAFGVTGGSAGNGSFHEPLLFPESVQVVRANTIELTIGHLPQGATGSGFGSLGFHFVPHATSGDWPLNFASAVAVPPTLSVDGADAFDLTNDGTAVPYGAIFLADAGLAVQHVASDGTAAEGGDKSVFTYLDTFDAYGIDIDASVEWGGVADKDGADTLMEDSAYHPSCWCVDGTYVLIVAGDGTRYEVPFAAAVAASCVDIFAPGSDYKIRMTTDDVAAEMLGVGNNKIYIRTLTANMTPPATGVTEEFGGRIEFLPVAEDLGETGLNQLGVLISDDLGPIHNEPVI